MIARLDVPREREAWQAAAVGCYWSFGPYTIGTRQGGGLSSGYVLTCNRAEIAGPSQYSHGWNTFEAAALAAGRHAAGKD